MTGRALLVIATGYVAGAVAYPALPGSLLSDTGDLWRPMIAVALPTMALVTFLVLKTLWRAIGRTDPNGIDAASQLIVFQTLVFLTAIQLVMMAALTDVLGARHWADRAVVVAFGTLLMSVGNVLPRTRPNLTIGIRTPRTLSSRSFWMQVHRATGYVVLTFGAVLVLGGFFLNEYVFRLIVPTASAVAVGAVVLLYVRHRSSHELHSA